MKLRRIKQSERTIDKIAEILVNEFGLPATVASTSALSVFGSSDLGGSSSNFTTAIYLAANEHGVIIFYASANTHGKLAVAYSFRSVTPDGNAGSATTKSLSARLSTTVYYAAQQSLVIAPMLYGGNGYLKDVYEVTKKGRIGYRIMVDEADFMYFAENLVIEITDEVK